MRNNEREETCSSRKWVWPGILAFYLIAGFILLYGFRYHINTDTPSYIAIAQKYAYGCLREAINGFWSPLISWLMVPFLWLDLDPLVAYKAIGLIAGLFAFIAIRDFLISLSTPEHLATLLCISFIPAFYAFTLITVNPDFLLAVILLCYVKRILATDYGHKTSDGVICGFLGTVAYLAKGFAFLFFLSHFTLINLCRYHSAEKGPPRKTVASSFVWGMATFVLLSSIWVFLISIKEGHVVFNKAGSYNLTLVAYGWKNPIEYSGFIPPPDSTAMSIWDDPAQIPLEAITPLDFKTRINNYLHNFARNLPRVIDVHQEGSIFSAAIFLSAILYLTGSHQKGLLGNKIFLILATMGLYTVGYLPILITKRYFFLNIFLFFILGSYFLYTHLSHKKVAMVIALFCLCLSFVLTPVRDLFANATLGKDIYQFSTQLKKLGISGRIASNGHLDDSIFASYHLGAKYFGIAKPGIGDAELLSEFIRYRIDYYFCWEDRHSHALLSSYPEISGGRYGHLRIYKVR